MPARCILEEVEFLKNGRYGPTCKGQLKLDEAATAVVVKTLKGKWNNQIVQVFCPKRHYIVYLRVSYG